MNINWALKELNLQISDHPDKIHHAYRQLVKRWHPDQFAHQPEIHSLAEEKLKRINQAYCILNKHIKYNNLNVCNKNNEAVKNSSSSKNKRSGPFVLDKLKNWLREVLSGNTPTTRRTESTRTSVNCTTPFPGRHQTRFDTILRNADSTLKRQPSVTHGTARKSRPVPQRYQRRSSSTRIEGFRPASPVTPVQPVPSIDPIEGSD